MQKDLLMCIFFTNFAAIYLRGVIGYIWKNDSSTY